MIVYSTFKQTGILFAWYKSLSGKINNWIAGYQVLVAGPLLHSCELLQHLIPTKIFDTVL